jgi:hypothetical protein
MSLVDIAVNRGRHHGLEPEGFPCAPRVRNKQLGINKREKIHPVTRELVQQAVKTLETAGEVVSVRQVNRLMRRTPPAYRGCSFRDLLPFLRHQHDTPKECYRQVLELIDALEAALSQQSATLPALLIRGEKTWRTCVPRLQAASLSVDGPTAAVLWPHTVREFRYRLAAVTDAVRG